MIRTCLLFCALAVALWGCRKEPGEGGLAEIRGSVYVVEYDDNTGQPTGDEYFAPEARVYIVYGDHDFHDDDVRTGPDGLFVFSWLRKGDSKVFTYSECPTCPSGTEQVSRQVTIDKRKEVITVPTLVIEEWR